MGISALGRASLLATVDTNTVTPAVGDTTIRATIRKNVITALFGPEDPRLISLDEATWKIIICKRCIRTIQTSHAVYLGRTNSVDRSFGFVLD
jgi:hypothetical protein